MPEVIIDGKSVSFSGKVNLIELATTAGIKIPFFCYHKALSISGNCRMCLVEVGTPARNRATGEIEKEENGQPKIAWLPKLQPACYQELSDGMVIRTNTDKVLEARKGVMEFLLANHPLDCPVCDQAGECVLQDYAFEHGAFYAKFKEVKRTFEPNELSDVLTAELNRCIHCDRCSRFTAEVVGQHSFTRTWRGHDTELATLPGEKISHNYQGNMADICPVGALTLTDFRFKSRVWFLHDADTICTSCGKGCNITASLDNENKIMRFTPRANDAVNGHWMCDYGRFRYNHLNENRAQDVLISGKKSTMDQALHKISLDIQSSSKTAVIVSASESFENLQVVAEFTKRVLKTPHVDHRMHSAQITINKNIRKGELLLAEDPFPNSEAARKLNLVPGQDGMDIHDMIKNAMSFDLAIAILDDRAVENPDVLDGLKKFPKLVVFSAFNSPLDSEVSMRIPIAAYTEQAGTWINIHGQEQKVSAIAPALAGIPTLSHAIGRISAAVVGEVNKV